MIKITILTYGCSLNSVDSEIMKHLIEKRIDEKHDLAFTDNVDDSDIVIVNTCAVKRSTEIHMLKIIKELTEKNKKVIVAGCLAQAMPEYFENFVLLGTENLEKINEAIDSVINNKINHFLEFNYKSLENKLIEKNLHSEVIEIVPISRGCLGNCTYCITKVSRGHLKSYPIETIIKRMKFALENDIKEIWLTSQDSFCYGFDLNTNIVNLVRKINSELSDFKFKTRIGMGNPNHLKLFVDDLISNLGKNFFKFLHIPVQSGSNKILKDMNRFYSSEEFVYLIDKIRSFDPFFSISTDIIVGFPTETEEDFQKTLELLEKIKPDVVNISRFGKRPKTKSWNFKEKHGREIKKWSRIITETANKIELERNKIWLNRSCEVLIDEKKENIFIGRNEYYKPIIFKNKNLKLGSFVKAKIVDIKPHFLVGEIE
ncbi:MAG: tRNA (N(6)-L-threonylcarbamoyladenosine(37)-C(2))-methylthiotransferase [Candidatus Woesearchaeota archaeon]